MYQRLHVEFSRICHLLQGRDEEGEVDEGKEKFGGFMGGGGLCGYGRKSRENQPEVLPVGR